jgi:hypothetical protein
MIQKYHTRGAEEQYNKMRTEKRGDSMKNKQAENLHIQKESRFYRIVNDIREEFRPQIKVCRDSNGLILNETPAAIMNR